MKLDTESVDAFSWWFSRNRMTSTDHVKVGQRTDDSPEEGSSLDGFDPHGVGEEHAENGRFSVN